MKNLFAIAAVAAMLVACSGNTQSNTENANAEAPACCQNDSTKTCCQNDSTAAAADSTAAPADSAAVAE